MIKKAIKLWLKTFGGNLIDPEVISILWNCYGKEKTKNTEHIDCHPTVRYTVGTKIGLSSEQVNEYVQNGWTNKAVEPPTKTIPKIIKNNLLTYFNLVFAVLAVLLRMYCWASGLQHMAGRCIRY